jgi:DegV family protein with EDD domain
LEEIAMTVRIVTDSASDLPQELVDKHGIEIVPLTIRFGDDEYVDRKDLSTDQFWTKLEQSSTLPETAAPSVGAFEEAFRRLADDGATGIVCVNLSSRLSATMQSAQVASKAIEGDCPVAVVDSKNASMGLGIIALRAAQRAAEGADVPTIVAELESLRGRVRVMATLDTLEYLRKGGRIGGAQAMLGSMLSIKPVIDVQDGAVEQGGKVRTRSKALRFLADHVPNVPLEALSILHANAPDIDDFIAMVQPNHPDTEIIMGKIGAVIGVHTGPRVVGVSWIEPV